MLRHPRKSSALSSLPDADAPLALTDLAICLKYLIKSWHTISELKLVVYIWACNAGMPNLPIPLKPLISFSLRQASATDTSSSWSLWKMGFVAYLWHAEVRLITYLHFNLHWCEKSRCKIFSRITNLTIYPGAEDHSGHHQCHCVEINVKTSSVYMIFQSFF